MQACMHALAVGAIIVAWAPDRLSCHGAAIEVALALRALRKQAAAAAVEAHVLACSTAKSAPLQVPPVHCWYTMALHMHQLWQLTTFPTLTGALAVLQGAARAPATVCPMPPNA